jgi:predicted RND superfamily exporter protein
MNNAGLAGAPALVDDLYEASRPVSDLGIEVTPASMEIAQAQLTQAIEDTQIISLAAALAAAMLLLIFYYWRVERRLGIVSLTPASVVVAWTFGTMALTGIALTPVTATLAALSIGIAVPFAIHVTSRFLEEGRTKADADTALRQTAQHTGGALAGSALTSAIGFSMLTTSTLLPFEQLGFVIIYVGLFSLTSALLILPSLLALWDRRHRRVHGTSLQAHIEQPPPGAIAHRTKHSEYRGRAVEQGQIARWTRTNLEGTSKPTRGLGLSC